MQTENQAYEQVAAEVVVQRYAICLAALLAIGALVGCSADDDATSGSIGGQVVLTADVVVQFGELTGALETTPVMGAVVEYWQGGNLEGAAETRGDGGFRIPVSASGNGELRVVVAAGVDSLIQDVSAVLGEHLELESPLEFYQPHQWFPPGQPATFKITAAPVPTSSVVELLFATPIAADTRLIVFRGNEVIQILADEVTAPGFHRYLWDGRTSGGHDLGSGAYWVVVEVADQRASTPVIRVESPFDLSFECRQFIEEHWSEEQFVLALATGALEGFFPEYGPGSTPEDVPLYVRKDADPDGWYTNILTWDVFAFGWREYWDDAWNAANHPDFLGSEFYEPQTGMPDTWFFAQDPLGTPLREQARSVCGGTE